jgi:phage recombination protein Bet
MNNLTTISQAPLASQFTSEEMQLITETVAKGATPKELELFLYRCKLMGLNPLKPGQIHFVKYGNSPGTIVVGIEGFRSIAGRTGKLSGIERGVNRDDQGRIIEGWAKVYRSDWQRPAFETVPMAEYNTGKAMWAKMPETMIKKVAECAALRMAFPDDLGGVYEHAELDQAKPPKTRAEELEELGQCEPTVWTFPFGSFKGKTLEQVHRDKKLGIPALQNARRLILANIENNEPYKNSNLDEMRGVVHLIEQYLDSLPEEEFSNDQGAFASFVNKGRE